MFPNQNKTFHIQDTLRAALSKPEPTGKKDAKHLIFDYFIETMEFYYSRAVSNMNDLKKRDDKRERGNTWEEFCLLYLQATGKYKAVWLLKDMPQDVSERIKLPKKMDNGIDIVAQLKGKEEKYIAVQCKYRKKLSGKVSWTTLSTFTGLCAVTGPWHEHVVMTNCSGVTRKVPKGPKDHSICRGRFRATKRSLWTKVAGLGVGQKLNKKTKEVTVSPIPTSLPVDLQEMRERRLLFLQKQEQNQEQSIKEEKTISS